MSKAITLNQCREQRLFDVLKGPLLVCGTIQRRSGLQVRCRPRDP